MQSGADYQAACVFLKSLNIHFSENWLLECLRDCKAQKPNITQSELFTAIQEKWLFSDLRDLKVASLPRNIKSHNKITLTGIFAVQVESMVDSARSSYSELQKIRGTGRNSEVSENLPEETHSKRCLTFHLCDGVQEVEAMEYEFIPQIRLNNPGFLPGFKVILIGPIISRKGMLLLKGGNIKVLGGKVSSLCHSNSYELLLLKRLGLKPLEQSNSIEGSSVDQNTYFPKEQEVNFLHSAPQSEVNVSETNEMDMFSENDDILLNVSIEPNSDCRTNHNTFSSHDKHFPNVLKQQNITSYISAPEKKHKTEETLFSGKNKRLKLGVTSDNNISQTSKCENANNLNVVSVPGTVYFDDTDTDEMELLSILDKSETEIGDGRNPMSLGKPDADITSNSFDNDNSFELLNTAQPLTPKMYMPHSVDSHPFVYLKQIANICLSKPTVFIIKGIILTLKSKISIVNDEFALRASITDGSFTVQVKFSSDVLEQVLEYSPAEIAALMSEKGKNSAISEKLKEIFFAAQQKLLSMNCLMEIMFFGDSSLPVVIRLESVQLRHLQSLKGRIISL